MKKVSMKLLALMVSVVLIYCVFPLSIASVSALDEVDTQDCLDLTEYTFDNIPEQLLENITADVDDTTKQNSLLCKSSEINSKEVAADKPTVVGLSTDSADDLTSLTVINSDGSKTLHRYFEDIKFIDESGKIHFKDNGIYESNTTRTLFDDYAFENGINNIKSFYPDKISEGLKLEFEELQISVKPIIESEIKKVEQNAILSVTDDLVECVEYVNVFGESTALQYIPTSQGFKENIVFNLPPQKYEFSFEVDFGGLIPSSMSGNSIYLLSPETKNQVAMLHPVDIKDSYVNEKGESAPRITLENSMELSATEEIGVYILTIHLNKSFLDDPNTVYPIIVDPTVSVNINNAQSLTVNERVSNYLNLNYCGELAPEGIMYTYVKTNSMSDYIYINTNNITSAYYKAYEFSGNNQSGYIQAYDFWFNTSIGNITYDMCHEAVTDYYPVGEVFVATSSKWVNIPITDLVISWIDAELSPNYIFSEEFGFILTFTHNSAKRFSPPGSSGNPPSIVINYTEDTSLPDGLYYIKNVMSGKYIDVQSASTNINNTNINVITYQFHGGPNQLWRVEHKGNGLYEMYSMYEFANRQYFNNSNMEIKTTQTPSDSTKFRIIQNLNGFDYRIFSITAFNECGALDMSNYQGGVSYWRKLAIYEYHGGDNQRWEFEPIEYSATVQDFYDNGMLTRWGMTDKQMQAGIEYWQDLAKDFYWEQFKLDISFSTPALFTSFADDCGYSTVAQLDSECTHSINHKNVSTIKEDFLSTNNHSVKNIYVQWLGHITYHNNDWGNNAGVHFGNGYQNQLHNGSYAMMRNLSVRNTGGAPITTFTANDMRARRTYLHELAHAFGAVDSYCKKDFTNGKCSRTDVCVTCYPNTTPYGANCIMANLQAIDMSNDMSTWLCAQCKIDIKTHLMKYFHQEH